jgi:acetylornithine deacetylase/succinyl-diaminopimelate desuccinylase-like protein
MLKAAGRPLRVPLHLALSYDEEIGCMGVRSLIDMLDAAPVRPRFCIVGEPTGMQVATGHKGKVALRATCVGPRGAFGAGAAGVERAASGGRFHRRPARLAGRDRGRGAVRRRL